MSSPNSPRKRIARLLAGTMSPQAALQLLCADPSPEAAKAMIEIVGEYAPSGRLRHLPVEALCERPDYAPVLFPFLLNHTGHLSLAMDIYRVCLCYCDQNLIDPQALRLFDRNLLKSYAEASTEDATLILELMRYVPTERIVHKLHVVLSAESTGQADAAAASLLHLGEAVPDQFAASC